MKVVVVGATGRLGAHVVAGLAEGGHDVLAASRSGAHPRPIHEMPFEVRTLALDIRLDGAVPTLTRELGAHVALVHVAASRPRDAAMNARHARRELLAVNVVGTMRVLEAARRDRGGASAVVYVSEAIEAEPLSDYAVSKLSGEDHVVSFGVEEGIRTVVLRLATSIHPRDAAHSVERALTSAISGIFDVAVQGSEVSFNLASQ